MLNLADRQLTSGRIPPRARKRVGVVRNGSDHQVAELAKWIGSRVERVTRGERPTTYRQLRHLLPRHGYAFGQVKSNAVEILRVETVRKGLLRSKDVTVQTAIGRIGYRNEGEEVSVKTLKELRRLCRLREEDGVDSGSFYEGADVIDAFVNRYRTVLRRLART